MKRTKSLSPQGDVWEKWLCEVDVPINILKVNKYIKDAHSSEIARISTV